MCPRDKSHTKVQQRETAGLEPHTDTLTLIQTTAWIKLASVCQTCSVVAAATDINLDTDVDCAGSSARYAVTVTLCNSTASLHFCGTVEIHGYHVMAAPPNTGVEKMALRCQQLSLYYAAKFG